MILCTCLLNCLAEWLGRPELKLSRNHVAPREVIFDLERTLERNLAGKLSRSRRAP